MFYALNHELWRGRARGAEQRMGARRKDRPRSWSQGRTWGTWKPAGGESYETALLASTDHDNMKDKNSQAYCIHASLYTMQGQAFMIERDRPCPSYQATDKADRLQLGLGTVEK